MSITSLPPELLTHICQNLEPQEWGALRITCHGIHRDTLEAYATRYFRTFSVLLTREGLDRLEEIAASETLRCWVQEIWIIPNLFEGWPERDKEMFKSPALANQKQRRLRRLMHGQLEEAMEPEAELDAQLDALFAVYEATSAEHRAILNSGLFATLEKCLPRLKNATTVGLRSYPIHLLLSQADYRFFHCLGLRELKSQLNTPVMDINLAMSSFQQKMLAMPLGLAFSQLLNAIIKSSCHVQSLHTCGGDGYEGFRPNYACGMSLGSLQLLESSYQSLLPLLSDLTTLHMCIRIKDHEQDPFDEDTFQRLHNILVAVAPRLKILTFAQWSPFDELSPLYFEDLSQKIQFSQLEELHLQSTEVTVDTFKCFLQTAAPSLKRLSMRRVSLVDTMTAVPDLGPLTEESGSWGPSLSSEVTNEIQELWYRIFEYLTNHLKLQFLQLSDLGYRGRYIALEDDLYAERGQPDAHPSSDPKDVFFGAERGRQPMKSSSSKDYYFDAKKASISFKDWVTQLRIKMLIPESGFVQLPGTSNMSFHQPGMRPAQPGNGRTIYRPLV
ncbi:uncharacterized protein N7511_011305 [Penicillium nucicola]|uniref:uncharacterized protein n=1 Tax=Penicillium nucicola TaxID=1850975 RepID=UPI0025458F2C|nr:uncharacterized protein N7511_011305 [Penicillium nucicola]KAJ5742573.1 hypothetical protein N7511_011305 [Penicillium nucicola]